MKLTTLAAEHGFEFTAEEAESVWNKAQDGELSDFELEVVSGGDAFDRRFMDIGHDPGAGPNVKYYGKPKQQRSRSFSW